MRCLMVLFVGLVLAGCSSSTKPTPDCRVQLISGGRVVQEWDSVGHVRVDSAIFTHIIVKSFIDKKTNRKVYITDGIVVSTEK